VLWIRTEFGLDSDSMGSLDPYPDPIVKCWLSLFMAEGFSNSLDVIYGGLFAVFSSYPEPDPYPDSLEMLEPDPDSMDPDLQH
jgi:hypothetical protein